jgi:hypothetical protein
VIAVAFLVLALVIKLLAFTVKLICLMFLSLLKALLVPRRGMAVRAARRHKRRRRHR